MSHPLQLQGLPVEVRRLIYAHFLSDFQCLPAVLCRHIKPSSMSGQKEPLRYEMCFFAEFKGTCASGEPLKASMVPFFVNKQFHDEYKAFFYQELTFHLPPYRSSNHPMNGYGLCASTLPPRGFRFMDLIAGMIAIFATRIVQQWTFSSIIQSTMY